MTEPTMKELISKSSLGGVAWCTNCEHPDLLHDPATKECAQPYCSCWGFRPMTPEEWLNKRPGETSR